MMAPIKKGRTNFLRRGRCVESLDIVLRELFRLGPPAPRRRKSKDCAKRSVAAKNDDLEGLRWGG